MFRRLIGPVAVILILLVGLFWGAVHWLNSRLDAPLAVDEGGYTLLVPRGSSFYQLGPQLVSLGLTESDLPLKLYVRFVVDAPIHAGEYRVEYGDSLRLLIEKLIEGRVVQHRLTFPEGRTVQEWLDLMAGDPVLSLQPLPSADALRDLVAEQPGDSPEGWFFPDTYTFIRGDDGLAIFRQAHERMIDVLTAAWGQRAADLPLKNPYEALILASIVEKETGMPSERDRIAGVFVRRLKKGMRLQTDPTVIYGLGDRFEGNLTRQHLNEETAYNTYQIAGLPPTPIANPGREAIEAVMNPAEDSALYFVARGDGSHQFSDTLAEHRRAVKDYQLKRRDNYRSSPAPAANGER
ncbi:MAG: hypothetical protein CMK32_14340 [Porticoccaceae bacterium]|nr:hypothetical protein [Porticoccaceae bacterium]